MGKVSKLARSHNLFIDFLNVSVLSDTVVYSAIPYEKIKAYMFLRRSLASLARAYKLHVYDFFSGTFGGLPPPPHTKKLATLQYCCPAFAHQKSGQMKMADSVPPSPPTRYTKSPPLADMQSVLTCPQISIRCLSGIKKAPTYISNRNERKWINISQQ